MCSNLFDKLNFQILDIIIKFYPIHFTFTLRPYNSAIAHEYNLLVPIAQNVLYLSLSTIDDYEFSAHQNSLISKIKS